MNTEKSTNIRQSALDMSYLDLDRRGIDEVPHVTGNSKRTFEDAHNRSIIEYI